MKFVIEAAGLTVAGGKELAIDLMTELGGHAEHHFTFIVPDLDAYKGLSGRNTRAIVCKKRKGLLHRARLLNYEVPRICRAEGADALLCLGNFFPRKRVCPTAVLLQNAWIVTGDPVAESRLTLREHLIIAYGRRAYRHLPSDITIIPQTQVMKDHLCGRYGINPRRLAIIPNAISFAKLGESPDRAPAGANEGARPFTFLCLAHGYAHKNIDILADAIRRLPKYTNKPAKCVITVAREHHPRARRLLERLDQGELAGKIENIGPVPSAMLPRVYGSADALILPTLLESFARTYLEALYFGLPILTSDRDFARDLCQDAAIYFDPLDADGVARAMARVMEDAGLHQRLVRNGQRLLAQSPTWDEVADRFVEVLERTARGEPPALAEPGGEPENKGESAELQLSVRRPKVRGYSGEKASVQPPAADDIRAFFNHEAPRWRNKYGLKGNLNSRVEQFVVRLAELFLPPSNILDLGCGTGEIAAALDQVGYRVTACDIAEEMIAVARRNHTGTAVNWVHLEPEGRVLPFPDGSFDAIVASSVFEYLVDVPRVAAEVARVLRPEGILLLTIPNPCNFVRKVEAWIQSRPLVHHLLALLGRVQRIHSYASYLRFSRNRFEEQGWQTVLSAANLAPLDERDFSRESWQSQARAPLLLLAVKRVATGGREEFTAEQALCRLLAR